ncbi:hypothetical protein RM553_14340 [Zunongwangia sp. F363]|uniref:Uncharacterized protein n=1 Tax=Autumnicola tepida TaxID=3075595 RepID=A0ABU3CCF2_9FLAO|nr:hypothetical protein [Zunongwangia sp. F363]MDT0644014.1 hypothetical protein [Zunongwangia sp. F363]
MGKIYFKRSSAEENLKNLKPKKETIDFLLNYSKALSVIDGKIRKYNLLLN